MKRSQHAARGKAAMPPKSSPAPRPKPSTRSRVIRYSLYALVLLTAVGLRFWLAGPRVPLPDLESVDPALAEDIENARASIWQSPRQPEKWGRMGMLLAAHAFNDEAVQCFEKAETLDPLSWKWPYLRAVAQEQTDPAAARDALREAAVVAADNEPMPRLLLVERLLEIGELDEAERHVQFALHHWPLQPRANLDAARLRFARGDGEGALVLLNQKAMDDLHTRRTAHQLAAQLHRALGHETAAAAVLERLKSLPPDEPWPDPWRDDLASYRTTKGAYIARVNELGRRGDKARLNRAVAEAIDRYPELAHLVTGRERLINGDAAGAEAALREAVRLDPRSVDALVSLGEAITQQKQHRQAEDVLRRAVKVEPTNGDAHLRLGRCLMEQDNHEAALVPLRSAVQYMPASSDAHTALAEALAATGKTEEADGHRQIAQRLGKVSAHGR